MTRHKPAKTQADEALSKVRVVRATLIGVRECLTDAIAFTDRGIASIETAHAEITEACAKAGIPFTPQKRKRPPRRTARKTRLH